MDIGIIARSFLVVMQHFLFSCVRSSIIAPNVVAQSSGMCVRACVRESDADENDARKRKRN